MLVSNPTIEEAIKHYGPEQQLRMLQEECGELIAVVNHFMRGRCSLADVMTEVADVQIMIEQIRSMAPIDEYLMFYHEKLDRLGRSIKKAKMEQSDHA